MAIQYNTLQCDGCNEAFNFPVFNDWKELTESKTKTKIRVTDVNKNWRLPHRDTIDRMKEKRIP